ncbi:DUF4422 domain-containing protein [Palleronia rufa]|uniref:DUF4422 domain-containing protein n=1 Tax=Palleronia rufa TaxID=1530186 RepID=UPI000568C65A|nr:DUF4422 domain-containing protein [Palleronia rufa]
MNATIYGAYHKFAPMIESASIRPIHVGRSGAAAPLSGMIGDDTGDHISDRNAAYCELTALYWAWKNDTDSSHVGLMHYRRVLDFSQSQSGAEAELFPGQFRIPDYVQRTEAWLAANGNVDAVVPQLHTMMRSVRDNYVHGHGPADFDYARNIVATHHPDWLAAFDKVAGGVEIRLANMCLLKRDLFDRYCAFLFDVLDRLEVAPIDRMDYSVNQTRYLGFIAERLFTVFVHRLQTEEPDLDIREVHVLNLSNALTVPYIADDSLNGPRHVNIAFSADRAYVPHTAAMLRSVLDRADAARKYNLFFLHSDVDAYALELLRDMAADADNAVLHEIPVANRFASAYRSTTRAPSNATYNRFLLFDLLPGVNRLLYMDVDMIALGDVAQIFDTEMGDHQIAAVPDYIMTRTLTGPTLLIDPDVPELGAYQRDVLRLEPHHVRRYFNAGLILFNFAAMDMERTGRTLLALTETGRYLFRDQDILNIHFKDSYLPLPSRMNTFNTRVAGYTRVPAENYRAAMAAKRDPLVIHYAAGDNKPWNDRAVPYAEHYWAVLIRTPFYSEVVAGLGAPIPGSSVRMRLRRRLRRHARELIDRFPALRKPTFALWRGLNGGRQLLTGGK